MFAVVCYLPAEFFIKRIEFPRVGAVNLVNIDVSIILQTTKSYKFTAQYVLSKICLQLAIISFP